MYFKGQYYHNLDTKSRLFIPARFREALGEEFVVFKAPDNCLFLYPADRFDEISKQFVNNPNRAVQRAFFANTADASQDKQGRFTLTEEQLKHAEINGEAVFVGAGERIELWNLAEFEKAYMPSEKLDTMDDFIF